MCFGSPSTKAADQAAAAEKARLASITNTQGAINNVYSDPSRAADITDFVKATRDYLGRDLDQQKALNDRQLKFALARGGMTGGSLQVDKQSELARDYSKGVLKVDQMARGAGANLEGQDQDARARLISLATTGLDATTGAQQAATAMKSSLDAGKSTAQTQGLGDMFANFTKFYQDTVDAREKHRGVKDGLDLYGLNANFITPKSYWRP